MKLLARTFVIPNTKFTCLKCIVWISSCKKLWILACHCPLWSCTCPGPCTVDAIRHVQYQMQMNYLAPHCIYSACPRHITIWASVNVEHVMHVLIKSKTNGTCSGHLSSCWNVWYCKTWKSCCMLILPMSNVGTGCCIDFTIF